MPRAFLINNLFWAFGENFEFAWTTILLVHHRCTSLTLNQVQLRYFGLMPSILREMLGATRVYFGQLLGDFFNKKWSCDPFSAPPPIDPQELTYVSACWSAFFGANCQFSAPCRSASISIPNSVQKIKTCIQILPKTGPNNPFLDRR